MLDSTSSSTRGRFIMSGPFRLRVVHFGTTKPANGTRKQQHFSVMLPERMRHSGVGERLAVSFGERK
jgi:hypothetical protein